MSEYGHESTPREPFRYRVCPFCGHATLAVYWDLFRFSCRHCSLEGEISRAPDGAYASTDIEVWQEWMKFG